MGGGGDSLTMTFFMYFNCSFLFLCVAKKNVVSFFNTLIFLVQAENNLQNEIFFGLAIRY